MRRKAASVLVTIFLALLALAHLVRLALHAEITVGNAVVPFWASAVAALVTGALAFAAWRLHRPVLVPVPAPEVAKPVIPAAPHLRDEHLKNCRVVTDRDALIAHLPRGGVVAEVGVLAGDFSATILSVTRPSKLYLFDTFDSADWSSTNRFGPTEHLEFVHRRFQAEIASKQLETRKGLSWEEIARFDDGTFSWIYIDGGHDYDSVHNDLEASRLKVVSGGIIVMNDYIMYDPFLGAPYGVVQATNEFCIKYGWEVVFLGLQQHMFNDVALRKI